MILFPAIEFFFGHALAVAGFYPLFLKIHQNIVPVSDAYRAALYNRMQFPFNESYIFIHK
jgi:hypothetical protein